MARTNGLLNISANFEPAIAEPFDARHRTAKLADLSTAGTFGAYAYIGMICSVYDDTTNNGLYILKALPNTTPANWEKIGSGSAPSGNDGDIQIKNGSALGADNLFGIDTTYHTFAFGTATRPTTNARGVFKSLSDSLITGSELTTNGSFVDNDGYWSLYWDQGAGFIDWYALYDNSVTNDGYSANYIEQDISVTSGQVYLVAYTVGYRGAGSVTPKIGSVNGVAFTATGSQLITANTTGTVKFRITFDDNTGGAQFYLSDISVKALTGGRPASLLFQNASTTNNVEMRHLANSSGVSLFFGDNSGGYATSTYDVFGFGKNTLTKIVSANNVFALGSNTLKECAASNNFGAGANVFPALSTSQYNVGLGTTLLSVATTPSYMVVAGYNIGTYLTSPTYSILMGSDIMTQSGATGSQYNTVLGWEAGRSLNSAHNFLAGYRAGYSIGTGNGRCVYIGTEAGYSNVTGADNFAFGFQAFRYHTGGNSIAIGYSAASNATTGGNIVAIGHNVQLVNATDSNVLVIMNRIYGNTMDSSTNMKIGFGITAPTSMLDVNGDIEVVSTGAHYFGDPTTNGTWKTIRASNNLDIQRRESGSYVSKFKVQDYGVLITPSTLHGTPATGMVCIDTADSNKLKWYDGATWQSTGGGGMAIGGAVSGSTNNAVLYVDGSGNLGNSSAFTYASSLLTTPDIKLTNVNTATYIPFVGTDKLVGSSSFTYNDTTKTLSVGGTSANFEVQSGVTTGNAFFTVVDNLAEAMIFRTTNGDRIGHIVSTNASESWNFFDVSKFDYQGLKIYSGAYTRTAIGAGSILMYDSSGANYSGVGYNTSTIMNFYVGGAVTGYSMVSSGLWSLQSVDTAGIAITGSLAVTNAGTDVRLGSYNYRTAGWLVDYRNGNTQTYQNIYGGLYYNGKWILGHDDAPTESVVVKPYPFNKIFSYISSSYTDNTTEAGSGNGTPFNMIASSSDYLYIGFDTIPFGQAYIKVAGAGSGITLAVEYYNGSTWGAVSSLSDGTSNLTQSGLITWTIPANMARVAINSVTTYWVRIKSSTTVTATPTAYSIMPCNCDALGVYAMPNDTTPALSVTKLGISKIRAGMSTSKASLVGLLNSNITAVGNVGSGEDNLITYSVPAYSLWTNGDFLECEWWGTYGANANNKTIKVYYGGTTVLTTGALAINSGSFRITLKVIRTGATTQDCIATIITDNALLVAMTKFATATETLSGAVTTKITGEATNDNDIVCEGFSSKVFNN